MSSGRRKGCLRGSPEALIVAHPAVHLLDLGVHGWGVDTAQTRIRHPAGPGRPSGRATGAIPRSLEVRRSEDVPDFVARRMKGRQRTLYRTFGVGTLFALYGVGFATERTYHRPGDVNLKVVRARPAASIRTSRLALSTYEPPDRR
jgi:hypothetical protein